MALVNGTYTINSPIGDGAFFLLFRDSEVGTPVRGRPYTGGAAHHWEITTTNTPRLYTVRNALSKHYIAYPGEDFILNSSNFTQNWYILPGESGDYLFSPDTQVVTTPNRTLVWNIAGGAPVSYAHIILYPTFDGAPNEVWDIRPVQLDGDGQPILSSTGEVGSPSPPPQQAQSQTLSRTVSPSVTPNSGNGGSAPRLESSSIHIKGGFVVKTAGLLMLGMLISQLGLV
ncbi:hypothetical protein FA15DRAFT_756603 [Coprinopsis marcescibilis]|uniref:Ricin B lectin domain-containing protein n=1 Tax=Coprinopsis marcescibilis TaxID=230819 RepID=A0A5C3KV53_COPMA|nr:hypothetical protein FA15DRAFT_756603 [Coprinopsis marcescibilis]